MRQIHVHLTTPPVTLFREPTRVPVADLHVLPGLQPLRDDVFMYLAERAVAGLVPVYFAAVPIGLIRPFDDAYDPARHPVGESAIQAVETAWRAGRFASAWVYPSGDAYILSDDYIILAAARRGQPDFLPCWVLGEPSVPGPEQVQGPVVVEEVARLLGLSSG